MLRRMYERAKEEMLGRTNYITGSLIIKQINYVPGI
jgi:hypothetical protein